MQGDLQKCVDLMWSIETAGDDRYIFAAWLPATVSIDDQLYMPPIAYDTVVSTIPPPLELPTADHKGIQHPCG